MKVIDNLNTSQLVEGQVISRDIVDKNNNLLLPAGATLDIDIIQSLVKRGISTVSVERYVELSQEEHEKLKSEIVNVTKKRFRGKLNDPTMKQLAKMVLKHKLHRLGVE